MPRACTPWHGGLGKGDAVFRSRLHFFSSGEVVAILGATPVFIDVNEDTFNMDVPSLEGNYRDSHEGKLRPSGCTHGAYLDSSPSPEIEVADKYGLKVLEDGAQGFSGELAARKRAVSGISSLPSLAKPLGCYGDGEHLQTVKPLEAHQIILHSRQGKMKYDNLYVSV